MGRLIAQKDLISAGLRYSALGNNRIVGAKTGSLGGISPGANVSNGTDTSTTYRQKIPTLPASMTGIRFGFSNWRLFPTEIDGANDITVNATLEYGASIYQLFFKGQITQLIKPGAEVLTDPIGITLPAGAIPYIRVYVSVASAGMTWPTGRYLKPGADCLWVNTDYTLPPNTTGNTTPAVYMYGPSCMLGYSNSTTPSVLIEGDSIASGTGENSGGDSTFGEQGFLERALSGNVFWSSQTRGSAQLAHYIADNHRRNSNQLQGATSVINQLGVNDVFAANVTLATLQSLALQVWTIQGQYGARVFQTTITPETTSTDSWATTVNQTRKTNESVRTSFNDWLRAGAPIVSGVAVAIGTAGALLAGSVGHPLYGYFEIADICETARNSGIWNVTGVANGYTADGTHPSTAMILLMVAGVNLSMLV